jgi:hypothetical protein
MAVNEEDPPTSREDAWLHRLADQRVQWEDQRVLMEVQLDCLQKVLQAPGTPEARTARILVDAHCRAARVLFDARAAAAEALLVTVEAAKDFARVSGSHSADSPQARFARVARTLLEAQEEAAAALLAAQTEAAGVLLLEDLTTARDLQAAQAEANEARRSKE